MKYTRIISPKRMAQDLREEKVGKKEFYLYSFIFVVGMILSVVLALGVVDDLLLYKPEFLSVVDKVLGMVFTLGSILFAYYINKMGDGKRFWYRYFSLEIPITIVFCIVGIVVLILADIVGVTNAEFYGYPDLAIFVALYAFYVFVLWKYMSFIAKK